MTVIIKELAERTTVHYPATLTSDEYSMIDKEAFARLIIIECINQCRQEWYDTNNDVELNAETDPRMVGIKIGIKQGAIMKSFTCDRCKAPTTYDHHYVILRHEMDLCERCLGDFKDVLKAFMDNQAFKCWSSDDPMRIGKIL